MEKFAAGNCSDIPESSNRARMKQVMLYPGDANMKKRKQICGTVEELNEPAAKHKCSEIITGSKSDEFMIKFLEYEDIKVLAKEEAVNMEIMGVTDKSAQGSNSSPGNSASSDEEKLNRSLWKAGLYVETCASWSNVLSGGSRLDGRIPGGVCREHEEIIRSNEELHPHQNNSFPDIDCLDECFDDVVHYTDQQQTADGLEEFLSATGVDRNMFLQPSEKWGLNEEALVDKQKQTIDKEFEQYFSMLML